MAPSVITSLAGATGGADDVDYLSKEIEELNVREVSVTQPQLQYGFLYSRSVPQNHRSTAAASVSVESDTRGLWILRYVQRNVDPVVEKR